ncbi:MAG: 2,3-bisphosphoglycerate-independent phosphoglycerate mutase, partial [Clostridia bacterium]|nr:2,3-bisphosphoglycerate-independent phosphoglycerate mutase [Clostridia bacterium]
MNKPKPLALLILDGYGLGEPGPDNAVWEAKTPVMDALLASCPNTKISASGLDVGLPEGQMGNSEVGHTNIGAGRVVYQDLPRITKAIEDGSFFENPAYIKAMDDAKAKNASLHILGLLSDGGVHSHITHIFAILEMSKRRGLDKVFFHCFLDGRDTGPETGAGYIKALADKCAEEGLGRIATVQGRFWGMDRDKRWERLQKGYDAIVRGEGVMNADPVDAVLKSYSKDITDEFVAPVICDPAGMIKSGDSVIFMNFRPDRAREMTWALNGYLPEGSTVSTEKLDLSYVCTAQYDAELQLPTAFPPETLHGTMGEYLSELGLRQFRIAETEKYAHVTFFFNGGVEKVYDGEDRVLIQSPREFPTYDLIPEMSAYKVKDELISHMDSGKYDFYVCNDIERRILVPGRFGTTYKLSIIGNVTVNSLSKCSRFVILAGTGGLGKSMMMRHLFLNSVDNYEEMRIIPVFIPLKDFDEMFETLFDYAYSKVTSLCSEITEEQFEDVLNKGKCLLLFDGLDEIGSSSAKRFERDLE